LKQDMLQDIRFAIRKLSKSPGFVVTVVLTLALAIGANAMVFAVVNALFLRPLNVPQVESLYAIQRGSDTYIAQSYPDYLDLRDGNHSFDSLAAYSLVLVGMDTGKNPASIWGYSTSGNYFDALSIQPYLGRFFHASDEHGLNSAPYVVLSWAYWHTHFQGDQGVLGKVVRLNKHPFTVIGVAPPKFHGTLMFFSPDIYVPMVNGEMIDGAHLLNDRSQRGVFEVLGHLKPGVTPAQADADLSSIGAWLHRTYPKDDDQSSFILVSPALHGNLFTPAIRAFLAGLMLLAALILLAACANLGSLFAARAADRGREVALRLALGSSRARILWQLMTEAALISFAGGAVGLAGSVILLHNLSAWRPVPQFPINVPLSPDANVYLVALLLTLASGFLFGVVPVRQVLAANPYEIVKAGSTARVGRRVTVRDIMLVVQIAICAVLVTSSMVAVRGLVRSLHNDFGFEPRDTFLVNTDLNMAGYTRDAIPQMQKQMLDAVREIPGVKAVALVGPFQPLAMGGLMSSVFRETTTDLKPANAVDSAYQYDISPGYFQAAATVLLSGRSFSLDDDKNQPRVAVVNQQLARELFGSDRAAVGKYFKLQDGTRLEVVGVAENGKYFSLTEAPHAAMFLPILQAPLSQTWLVVRSQSDSLLLAEAIREKLHGLDPGLPVFIQPWTKGMDGALFPVRVATVSLGVLGIMGAMLSITGLFGMAAYSVSKRMREFGIRVALGARRLEVLWAALGRAVKLLAIGSVGGLILGILASRVLAFIVYQATPRDPLVLAGVVLAMSLLGLVATWIPAQRALAANPMDLLREE